MRDKSPFENDEISISHEYSDEASRITMFEKLLC